MGEGSAATEDGLRGTALRVGHALNAGMIEKVKCSEDGPDPILMGMTADENLEVV